MIKFRYAIHKETGFVLTYDKWLQHFYEWKTRDKDIMLTSLLNRVPYDEEIDISKSVFIYGINDIFTTDDFEIIYESDFTREELDQLRDISHTIMDPYHYREAFEKVRKLLEREWKLEFRYGIRE